MQILGGAVLGGTSGFVATLLMRRGAAPDTVGTLRVLVGGAALLLVVLHRQPRPMLRRLATPAMLAAGVGVAIFQLAFFRAVQRTGLSVSTVVTSGLQPVLTAGAGVVVLRELLHRRWYPATAACVIGIAVLMLGRAPMTADRTGIALAAVAGAGFTMFTIATKLLLGRGHGSLAISAVALCTAALVLAPGLADDALGWLRRPDAVALTLYLGVGSVGMSYALFTRGLATVRAGTAATLALAEPVTGALLGVLALGEVVAGPAWVGLGLVLVGIVLLARTPTVRHQEE